MENAINSALALAVMLGVSAGPALAQGKISDDAVRIGVLTDMSGLYSDIGGQGSVAAAQLAIDDFGGKVLGKKIELVSSRPSEQGGYRGPEGARVVTTPGAWTWSPTRSTRPRRWQWPRSQRRRSGC